MNHFKAHEAKHSNPPVIAREYLESLGYRLTDERLENEAKRLKILALQRIEDGSVPDFCFCSNLEETVGVILPQPFTFYRDTSRT